MVNRQCHEDRLAQSQSSEYCQHLWFLALHLTGNLVHQRENIMAFEPIDRQRQSQVFEGKRLVVALEVVGHYLELFLITTDPCD